MSSETWPDSWLSPGEARGSRTALHTLRRRSLPTVASIAYSRRKAIRARRLQQLARGIVYTLLGAAIVTLAWLAFSLAAVIQHHG